MTLSITSTEDVDRLIARFMVEGFPHRAELIRATRRREINLVEMPRDAAVPTKLLANTSRPMLVLIGDDDGYSCGPTGWTGFRRLQYWAAAGFVHATGATIASYICAIEMAKVHRRFVLIETASRFATEWSDALIKHRIKGLTMIPPPGNHHPVTSREQGI